MERRRYLAAVAAAALAGCPSGNDGTDATATATQSETPAATPTATETATATSTSTETATATETPTPTPEPTPTAFEAAVAETEEALLEMYNAYISQGEGAQSLTDVDASVEDFDDTSVYELSNEVDEARRDASEAASDGQADIADSLQAIRGFLYQAALVQAQLSNAHEHVKTIWTATDNENASAISEPYDRATFHEYRAARSGLRDTEDAGSPSDAEVVEFFDADEWEAKLSQFDAEVDVLAKLEAALEELQGAVQNLSEAHGATDSELASDAAGRAVNQFETVLDELDTMLREGVAESFERLLEDLEATCQEKRRDALAIESG